jgi:hypothetical protein
VSRTDKDLPYWLNPSEWQAWHRRCQYVIWRRPERDCDLPAEPNPERPDRSRSDRCIWWPTRRGWHYDHPPAWFVDHVWASKSRWTARDECTRARQEYRASGEVDVIPTVAQHRHGARWLWS